MVEEFSIDKVRPDTPFVFVGKLKDGSLQVAKFTNGHVCYRWGGGKALPVAEESVAGATRLVCVLMTRLDRFQGPKMTLKNDCLQIACPGIPRGESAVGRTA